MVIFPDSVVVRQAAVPPSHDVQSRQISPTEVQRSKQFVPDVGTQRGVLLLRYLAGHPPDELLQDVARDGVLGVPPGGAQTDGGGTIGRLQVVALPVHPVHPGRDQGVAEPEGDI